MIGIRSFKTYFDSLIPLLTGVSKLILVTAESQLAKKIADIAMGEIFLVLVVPSATDNMTDHDNLKDEDKGLLYALKKTETDRTADNELTDLEQTQNVAIATRNLIYSHNNDGSKPSFVHHIRFEEIDPEYNYQGCDGYSMSFKIVD